MVNGRFKLEEWFYAQGWISFLNRSRFLNCRKLRGLDSPRSVVVLWCYNTDMEKLIDSYSKSKNLHHAYFVVGEIEDTFSKLKSFLKESVKVKIEGSADFWSGKYNTLNIEGARDIAESQGRKDFEGKRKVYIIQADFITEEAQNSLLKVFEEPTEGTHFFILSPQDILLPTLRSRVQVIFNNPKLPKMSKSLFDMNLAERLALVKEITEGISDEEKTKQDAIALLNGIETELYSKGVEKSFASLKTCEESRLALYDRGAPIKIILENLMLSI